MSEVRISYTPRTATTPEAELSTLAAVYKFVLEKKNAASVPSTNGDDAKKGSQSDRARDIIPERH